MRRVFSDSAWIGRPTSHMPTMLTTRPQTAMISSVLRTMCTWVPRMYAACGASDSDTSIAYGVGVPSELSTGR